MSYQILIADDASINRRLIRDILKNSLLNVTFHEAENGHEVLAILDKKQIDLIILDLVMPEMDGFETLRNIKENPLHHDIPVIVNSSITEIHSIESILQEGAVDYFTKPLSVDDMNIILPLKAKNALLLHEQSKQMKEELKYANIFANIMLPKAGKIGDMELFIKYHPTMGIGGDFFDCIAHDGKTYFMIADVTGHGIAAGMASSMVKILFRKCVEKNNLTPDGILSDINKSIFQMFDFAGKDNFLVFTAFVGVLDQGVLKYSNAGQPYPVIYHEAKQEMEEIKQNGFLVGMFENPVYETEEVKLTPGDVVFLYTDGLFCSGESSDITGWKQVIKFGEQYKNLLKNDPDEFMEQVFYAFHLINKSQGTDFTDDVAMMLLKYEI